MAPDIETLSFASRGEYRSWLEANGDRGTGAWLVFVKGNKGFTANDALEESICFGWIDGVLKSIDGASYMKYFSRRKDRANWSERNKAIFVRLDKAGLLTEAGRAAYASERRESALATGAPEPIGALRKALQDDGDLLERLDAASPSMRKRLAMFYLDAKADATRKKRLARIAEALRSGFKGMLY